MCIWEMAGRNKNGAYGWVRAYIQGNMIEKSL